MNCREAGRRLSALADGELPAERIPALEAHLAGCPRCARTARLLEEVRTFFRNLPRPAAPPDLADRVAARIRGPGARLLSLVPLLRTAAVAAVVLLGLSTGLLLLRPGPRPAPTASLTADGALELIMDGIARDTLTAEVGR